MSELPTSVVKQWEVLHSYYIPKSADYKCPACEEHSHHYKTGNGQLNSLKGLVIDLQMTCTRCSGISLLWAIGVSTNKEKKAQALQIWPNIEDKTSSKTRSFIDFENDVVPEKVLKKYKEAVRAFEADLWNSAGTLCGQTLEGAIKSKLPDGKKGIRGLGQQLNALKQMPDLSDPFDQLTNAIHVGRNISAHFDEDIEIDRETAEALIDLVQYVLEFFFIYANKAQALNQRMQELKGAKASYTTEADTEAQVDALPTSASKL